MDSAEVLAVNKQCDAIDAQIATLRSQKKVLADKRKVLIEEQEIQLKLRGMTREQRQRVVLKVAPINATSEATK